MREKPLLNEETSTTTVPGFEKPRLDVFSDFVETTMQQAIIVLTNWSKR